MDLGLPDDPLTADLRDDPLALDLPDDLRWRLRVAAADLLIGPADPRDAVMLACDLLVAGASGDATVKLAIQRIADLSYGEVEWLLMEMLREWGIEEPDDVTAGRILSLDLSRRYLAGELPPESTGHRLLGGLDAADDRNRSRRLLALLDRLEDDLGGHADDEFRAGLAALAREVTGIPPYPEHA